MTAADDHECFRRQREEGIDGMRSGKRRLSAVTGLLLAAVVSLSGPLQITAAETNAQSIDLEEFWKERTEGQEGENTPTPAPKIPDDTQTTPAPKNPDDAQPTPIPGDPVSAPSALQSGRCAGTYPAV